MQAKLIETVTDECLHIVLTDDYLSSSIAQIAAIDRHDRRALLICRASGIELWIGPLLRPQVACFECLTWRLRTNGAVERYLGRRIGQLTGITRAIAHNPIHDGLIAHFAALEAFRWISGQMDAVASVKTLDLRSWQSALHTLESRPQCPCCGDPGLQSRILVAPLTIGLEEATAPLTVDDLMPFVSHITGVVTGLARAETGVSSLHSYTAYFGFGRDARNLYEFKSGLLSQAAGVGPDPNSARIGAICEALERYSGMTHGDEPAITAAFSELDSEVVVDPTTCMLYSARQYKNREDINAKGAAFDLIPNPFDERAAMDWTGVWSLSAKRFKLLPSTYLFYNYKQPKGGPFCWADSNGCAAGSTLTNAVLRGLLELIERDSVAIWWYNRLARPLVDLSSFNCDYFDRFLDAYGKLSRDVWVLDLTTDLGVPSFVAISRYTAGLPEDILLSFGAHFDAQTAIEHALSEMNHILPAVLPQNRDQSGQYPYPDPSQQNWWRNATIESEHYLLANADAPAIRADDYPVIGADCDAERVGALRERLEQHGMEVLVLNQSRPDIGIPVAKVIVPGLRHFWARFAPGRLYDVPVKMGWIPDARSEVELNPIAMFL
jgi:ribosomal protein S12 methylthiotransferase accessory factor